jgi:hypothetical protein
MDLGPAEIDSSYQWHLSFLPATSISSSPSLSILTLSLFLGLDLLLLGGDRKLPGGHFHLSAHLDHGLFLADLQQLLDLLHVHLLAALIHLHGDLHPRSDLAGRPVLEERVLLDLLGLVLGHRQERQGERDVHGSPP